jgi:hypothetical protein
MAKGRPRIRVFDEDAAVARYLEVGNSHKVAVEFGTGSDVILRLVKARGISINKSGARSKFSDDDIVKIKDLYVSGKSQGEIAVMFGVSQQGIGKVLGRSGVDSRKTFARVDEHYFDIIDSEEKAYWFGFLAADGWISKSKAIGLSLHPKDTEHIKNFSVAVGLGGEYLVNSRDEPYVLFKSVVMWDSLVSKGFTLTKSKDLVIHGDVVPIDLKRHFWRGMIDGDGSLPVAIRYGHRRDSVELVGTRSVCESFAVFCSSVGCGNPNPRNSQGTLWHVAVTGIDARKLMKVLYDGVVVALERKKMIAEGRYELVGNGVRIIEREMAVEFLKEFHYLKTLPIGVCLYGWFDGGDLCGVAAIGAPSHPGVGDTVFGKGGGKVVELRRFAISKNEPNAASRFLAEVLRRIKVEYDWEAMISFADSAVGHYGTIYQACGARYVGHGDAEVVVDVGGERLSGDNLVNRLKEGGLDEGARIGYSGGKMKYVFFLKKDIEEKCLLPSLPYPKKDVQQSC